MDLSSETEELKLYFGDPYVINNFITVLSPTIGQIVDYGERKYFTMVHTLCCTPQDMISQLWDMGLDFEKLEDFELFMMLAPTLSKEATEILLGDLDLSKLKPYRNPENGLIVLADKESGVRIDVRLYDKMVSYIREMHGFKKKPRRKSKNEFTKKYIIEQDRKEIEMNKDKKYKSFLFPLVSSMKVRYGLTKEYVRNMNIYEFMSDVSRSQVIVNSDALLGGMYSGMIDTSKIKSSEVNWMREIEP